MGSDEEYLINGSWLKCNQGTLPNLLRVPLKRGKIQDKIIANNTDLIPQAPGSQIYNIPSFGICKILTKMNPVPCVPAPVMWMNFHPTLFIQGGNALTVQSMCQCGIGGQITIDDSSQTIRQSGMSKGMWKSFKDAIDKTLDDPSSIGQNASDFYKNALNEGGLTDEGFQKAVGLMKNMPTINPVDSLVKNWMLDDVMMQTEGKVENIPGYFKKSFDQIWKGSFTKDEDTTAVGTIGEMAVGGVGGFFGIDAPLDVRDALGHFNKGEVGWGLFSLACLLPVVGSAKIFKKPIQAAFKAVSDLPVSQFFKALTGKLGTVAGATKGKIGELVEWVKPKIKGKVKTGAGMNDITSNIVRKSSDYRPVVVRNLNENASPELKQLLLVNGKLKPTKVVKLAAAIDDPTFLEMAHIVSESGGGNSVCVATKYLNQLQGQAEGGFNLVITNSKVVELHNVYWDYVTLLELKNYVIKNGLPMPPELKNIESLPAVKFPQ